MRTDEVKLATASTIVQEIRQFEQRIATLRMNLNQLTPFSRIPDDVLLDIFFQIISETHAEHWAGIAQRGVSENEPYDQWFASLSQVCRRWRTLVINSPCLWSCITLTRNTACISKAIKLSGNAILHLRASGVSSSHSSPSSGFVQMLQQLPRARTLELRGWLNPTTTSPTFMDVDVTIAPVLTTVRLDHLEQPLLAIFQPLSMPSLKYLAITSGTIQDCRPFLCPSLTFLELRHPGHSTDITPDFLLDTLEHLSLLEVLKISLLFIVEGSTCRRSSHVDLPRMRFLEVGAPAAFCADILDRIVVPPHASLCVNLMLPHIDEQANVITIDRVMKRLQDSHLKAKYQHPLRLHLQHGNRPDQDRVTVSLRPKVELKPPTGDPNPALPPLAISVMSRPSAFDQSIELVSPYLARILPLLPLEEVHDVTFVGPDKIISCDPDGTIFLQRLKNVTYLACVTSKRSPGRIGHLLQRLLASPAHIPDLQRLDIRNLTYHSLKFKYQLQPVIDQIIVVSEARERRKPGFKVFFVESYEYDKDRVRDPLAALLLWSVSPEVNVTLDLDAWEQQKSSGPERGSGDGNPSEDEDEEVDTAWLSA